MLPSTTLVYPLLAVYAVNLITVNEDTYATSPTFFIDIMLIIVFSITKYKPFVNFKLLVGILGLEPRTFRLSAECSTN